MFVRQATIADIDEILSVIESHSAFSGITDKERLSIIRAQQHSNLTNILDAPKYSFNVRANIFLCFDGLKLVGVMIARTSEMQACFYLVRSHTLNGITNGPQVLSYLIEQTLAYYTYFGYQRFYTLYRKKHIEAYQRLWRTSVSLKNWISYTEIEVPPNVKVQHFEFWDRLYGRMLIPETTVVRCFVNPVVDVIDRR